MRSPVTRRTSASEVTPARARRIPSWRIVVIPAWTAAAKISSDVRLAAAVAQLPREPLPYQDLAEPAAVRFLLGE